MLFFAFYKPSKINLEGEWMLKKILFNGKDVFTIHPEEEITFNLSPLYNLTPQVKINNWNDSIYIFNREKSIRASLNIKYDQKEPYALLSSNEKLLNGKFDLKIDTLNASQAGPGRYNVNVELTSKNAYLNFIREVYPKPPQKVPLPRRGAI